MIVATSPSAESPLVLREMPTRKLRGADVRVRVRAIGVNPVDWKMRSGGPLRFAHFFVGPSGPLVVGVDFAGAWARRRLRFASKGHPSVSGPRTLR